MTVIDKSHRCTILMRTAIKTQLSQKCILKKYPLLRTLSVGEQKVKVIGQRRLTGAHTPVRGNPRELKVVQLNSWFCFIVTIDLGCTDSQAIILKLQQKHIAELSNDNSYSHRTKITTVSIDNCHQCSRVNMGVQAQR